MDTVQSGTAHGIIHAWTPSALVMQLLTLGGLAWQGASPGRPSPQQLLLLAYVRLEQETSRWTLARLFWPHLDGEFTAKGERRDLSNLGVARATLRAATGLDIYAPEGVQALSCDAADLDDAVRAGDARRVTALCARGEFLRGVEHKTRLKLSSEVLSWIEARRAQLHEAARALLLGEAEQLERAGRWPEAVAVAEQALGLGAGRSPEWPRLHALLARLGAPSAELARQLLSAEEDALRGQLTEEAFRYYLLRSLTDEPHAVVVQRAAQLSLAQMVDCTEALRELGLLTEGDGLNPVPAQHYLALRPALRLELLGALREHTPPEHAYAVYRQLFEISEGFGGLGYWDRARLAYDARANRLIQAGDWPAAAEVLAQFEQAERLNGRPPHPDTRFLQSYTLERLGQPGRALEVLDGVVPAPEVQAMRATLLVQTHRPNDAQPLAERVLAEPPGAASALARALAANALGQIEYAHDRLAQAELLFEQAAACWALSDRPEREPGALMNRANVLLRAGRSAEAGQAYHEVIAKAGRGPLRVHALLNLGVLYGQARDWTRSNEVYGEALKLSLELHLPERDARLAARVYHNVGYAQYRAGDQAAARTHLNAALELARAAGDRLWSALALANLALLDASPGKFEVALGALAEGGDNHYLEEYEALYAELLTRLALDAVRTDRTPALKLYVGKLAEQLERRGQPERARHLRASLDAKMPPNRWAQVLEAH